MAQNNYPSSTDAGFAFLANLLKPVSDVANQYNQYQVNPNVPLLGGQNIGSITGVTGTQSLLNEMGQGYNPVYVKELQGLSKATGRPFNTLAIDPRLLDVSSLLGTGAAVKQVGKAATSSLLNKSAIEAEAYKKLQQEYPAMKEEYATLKDAHADTAGGRVLNTDAARELFPEYKANRTLSADVHEPASQFIKDLYQEKLSNPTPAGLDNTVVFTAGGTGAGKTSTIRQASSSANDMLNKAEMIYDTNMNTFSSADKKINQALDAGRDVQIFYTYRDPVTSLVEGALPRASRMEAAYGSGRTVPIGEHLKTHVGSRETIQKLSEKYKDNPNVHISVIDNTGGAKEAKLSTLDKIPELDENEVRRKLNDALEKARNTVSERIYKATKGSH